ncbi:MAG: hypothetical protein KF796_19275 [Ramlibacter sp.]|nr:hypothetical protein [Ramlibacter sp.]
MTLEVNLAGLLAIATAFLSALWALVKVIGAQQEKRLSEKFGALTETLGRLGSDLRQEADATRKLETAFLKFQAELPRDYVRRDDFLREVGTIGTRIDNFALRMERALDKNGMGL